MPKKNSLSENRRGRHLTGWLPVDKPAGITSAEVVNHLKRQLLTRKAGHAGTLDKPATGVLAIAFGEATKTIPYVMDGQKTYIFEVRFGATTTTDDATGEILDTSQTRPSDSDIQAALRQFRGDILQVPPQYSAIKIDGKRAAAYAASGQGKKLMARSLKVNCLELISRASPDLAKFEMVCGKGGYVRSIARDLGEALGCLGHVKTLRRTGTGPFTLRDSIEFRDDRHQADLVSQILPLETGLKEVEEIPVNFQDAQKIQSGNFITINPPRSEPCIWASHQGQAIAIGTLEDGIFRPRRVIHPNDIPKI